MATKPESEFKKVPREEALKEAEEVIEDPGRTPLVPLLPEKEGEDG